ncbi:LytR/AlgR family response regulator transcription factor [Flavivirga spongiicola]|uniref:LytTR family DNA-binding domain-containing protein n=1 Tax=Flavivirga spongiicola TaxID=421621 RepID=A0ABU7XQU4_9FLAO|nr:LytTR family DNA-binding domain-containing protein [Flavivirga sp. MEBiC05379]MDO5977955.1 LytTR family DNA-binding domain-containing protein [Flavivirga sp. MEBiC05379]
MIRAILVDDEKGALETLSGMLSLFCKEVQVLGKAASANEARDLIKKYHPDLVFLDIRMPFENGFDLLESIDRHTFHVIFTTAYNNYALKAIKFSVLDYLLKPIDVEELQRAVSKVSKIAVNKEQYSVFKAHQLNHEHEQILLPYKNGFQVVNYHEILRFEGERNYTYVYFLNGKRLLVAKTLKEYEELLKDYGFFRVHQSNIVNMKCVKGYINGRGGKIQLIDNTEVDLARSRKKEFLTFFKPS